MNFKKFFITLIAASAALLACTQEEDFGLPRISVDPTEISLGQGEESASVQLTATRDWLVQSAPDWIGLSVNEGKASTKAQTVSLTANANSGYNRSGEVVFTIGLAKCAVTVNQAGAQGELKKGTGTKDDPYTVTGVIEYVQGLGADVTSPSEVYVKGKVAAITEAFSAQYGNGTFTISDDGSTAQVFTCYRILYLGNRKWTANDTQIAQGDDVIVCGKVVNYKGNTPETSQGSAFLYSLNGKTEGGDPTPDPGTAGTPKGSGTQADPFNVAAAIAKAKETGETATSDTYYIKGKVSEVTEQFAAQYGNATFKLVDEGYAAAFLAYRVLYFNNVKWTAGGKSVNVNDEVVVCAKIVNFKGNTPETSGGYVYSINGDTGGDNPGPGPDPTPGDPKGSGTLADPYNAAGAYALAAGLTSEQKSDDVYVAGKISSIKYTFSAQYGTATFNISDDGTTSGSQFTCYSVLYLNNRAWADGDTQVKVGDSVVIYGKLVNYQGNTPETSSKEAYIYSLNGVTDGGEPTPGPDPGSGGGDFSSNVSWTAGTSCYDDNVLNVNGESGVANLKFGTSKKYGDASVVIPAGTKTVTFYSIAWKGADASLKVTAGGKEYTFDVKANDGASGNAPYNVTVTDNDKYTLDLDSALSSDVTVKVETYEGNNKGFRAFIFGVKAQ
ncbi:MAG: BACON domain-containing protein [Bacteroidales bacterium]|nr:BACON domain-containing protein [Bacteroidales bacterium]